MLLSSPAPVSLTESITPPTMFEQYSYSASPVQLSVFVHCSPRFYSVLASPSLFHHDVLSDAPAWLLTIPAPPACSHHCSFSGLSSVLRRCNYAPLHYSTSLVSDSDIALGFDGTAWTETQLDWQTRSSYSNTLTLSLSMSCTTERCLGLSPSSITFFLVVSCPSRPSLWHGVMLLISTGYCSLLTVLSLSTAVFSLSLCCLVLVRSCSPTTSLSHYHPFIWRVQLAVDEE